MSTQQSRHEDVKFMVDMLKSDFPEVGKYVTWILVGFASAMVVLLYVVPFIVRLRNGNS